MLLARCVRWSGAILTTSAALGRIKILPVRAELPGRAAIDGRDRLKGRCSQRRDGGGGGSPLVGAAPCNAGSSSTSNSLGAAWCAGRTPRRAGAWVVPFTPHRLSVLASGG